MKKEKAKNNNGQSARLMACLSRTEYWSWRLMR